MDSKWERWIAITGGVATLALAAAKIIGSLRQSATDTAQFEASRNPWVGVPIYIPISVNTDQDEYNAGDSIEVTAEIDEYETPEDGTFGSMLRAAGDRRSCEIWALNSTDKPVHHYFVGGDNKKPLETRTFSRPDVWVEVLELKSGSSIPSSLDIHIKVQNSKFPVGKKKKVKVKK